jgi:hypothetical protein
LHTYHNRSWNDKHIKNTAACQKREGPKGQSAGRPAVAISPLSTILDTMALAEKQGGSIPNLVDPRFERIGGIEYAMSSPGYKHQMTLLATALFLFVIFCFR